MDGLKPRAPLRLSVEERVDYAVQEAVRKALDEQRRTQERELDTLSDALQRSLAALAGERDRALRALAAEEEKRCTIVNDVSRLLGGELSAAHVSRLAMGLECLELEHHSQSLPGRNGDEPHGRAWLIEQLRQCVYTRAATQDHLRVAAQQLADDRFDAEEFLGLGPALAGSGGQTPLSPPIFPPSASARSDVAKPGVRSGVAPARAAASEALKTSLQLARERVSYLESLMRDVSGDEVGVGAWKKLHEEARKEGGAGGDVEGKDVRASTERGGVKVEPDDSREGGDVGSGPAGDKSAGGAAMEKRQAMVGGVDGDGQKGGASGTSDEVTAAKDQDCVEKGSDEERPSTAASLEVTHAVQQQRGVADGGGADGSKTKPENVIEVADEAVIKNLDENEDRLFAMTEERIQAPTLSGVNFARNSSYHGPDGVTLSRKMSSEDKGLSRAPEAFGIDESNTQLVAAREEARRWRRTSQQAEASRADLREIFGDVLALSFRCGEEHARQRLERDGCIDGDHKATGDAGGGTLQSGVGNEKVTERMLEHDHTDSPKATTTDGPSTTQSGVDVGSIGGMGPSGADKANHVREGLQQDTEAVLEGGEGKGALQTWCAVGGSGEGGRGGGGCKSCEARTMAVHGLLTRLQMMSVEQGKDLARMDASLETLRQFNPSRNAAATSKEPMSATTTRAAPAQQFLHGGEQLQEQSLLDDGDIRTVEHSDGRGRPDKTGALGSLAANMHKDSGRNNRTGDSMQGSGIAEDWRDVATAGHQEQHRGFPVASQEGLSRGRAGGGSGRVGGRVGGGSGSVGGGGSDGGGRDGSSRRDVRTEWQELDSLDTNPALYHGAGSGGLGSPMVQGVLDLWIDVSKRRILEGWLAHVLHGGPVDAANGCFVPRVQISSLSKEVRDGLVSIVLPLLLHRRGVLLQVLTRERVELVHDIQIRVTPVAGRKDAPFNTRSGGLGAGGGLGGGGMALGGGARRRGAPVGEREHGARIRDMVMKAAHAGYVEEDEPGGSMDTRVWANPRASVDSLSRQLRDTWDSFNENLAMMKGPRRVGGAGDGSLGGPLPEYG